jgi:hypothetical protein
MVLPWQDSLRFQDKLLRPFIQKASPTKRFAVRRTASARVARRVFEKIAKNVAHDIFLSKLMQNINGLKSGPKSGLFL